MIYKLAAKEKSTEKMARRGTLRSTYLLSRVADVGTRDVLALVAQRQVAQLVTLVDHEIADGEVYDSGQEDADPDGDVVGEDA